MAASRPLVIIGNWKMHKTMDEALAFVDKLLSSFTPMKSLIAGLAVPYTMIQPLSEKAKGTSCLIGAQNMNDAAEGAFTGEIAATMLTDAGASFVLLGHSERRRLYGEDDAFINRKVKRAVEAGLQPILCVGETKEEYDNGQTHAVIERQLRDCLYELKTKQLSKLIIAYEPVWAIGNGKSATPEIAQGVHHFCRQVLSDILTPKAAEKIVIQYGGSVNASNAKLLLAQPDIDGLLIGGASLSLESFCQIVNDKYLKNEE